MPKPLAINGAPGIGKSTVAEIVFSRLPNPVLDTWDRDGNHLFAPPPSFALELLHE
ncbi:MAG TPA: hypothetical protein VM537_16460 [Anaerolineae bacterium]|nr:hypothetical protein [Anaerolineae bacterium]